MNHIFISYHHHECDFAACLRMEVEALGLDTWIDKRKLRAGDDWRNEIDNGIKNAVALIVVMTPEARASDYVTYEWAFALGYGIKVIPIMLKTTPLHPRLDVLQYIDFTNQQRPWDELKHVLTSLDIQSITTDATDDIPIAIRQAEEALNSINKSDREAAIASIGQIDHPYIIQVLLKALEHPYTDVREAAAEHLPRDTVIIDPLIERVDHHNKFVRTAAISILGRELKSEKAVDALIPLVNHFDIDTQREAILSLGCINDDRAIAPIIECLNNSKHPFVRSACITTLGSFSSQPIVPLLLTYIQDTDVQIRHAAITALGRMREVKAVEQIFPFLRDMNINTRRIALRALAMIFGEENDHFLLKDSTSHSYVTYFSPSTRTPFTPFSERMMIQHHDMYIDPAVAINFSQVIDLVDKIKKPLSEIRKRYEMIAERYGITLGWNEDEYQSEVHLP